MHLPLHDSETNSEMDHECQRTAKQAQEEMQETIKHALHTLHTLFIQNEANVYRIPSISIVITSISQSPILYYRMAYQWRAYSLGKSREQFGAAVNNNLKLEFFFDGWRSLFNFCGTN
jgi:hypothetical protein